VRPVIAAASRKESRISIGRIDVQVTNRPAVRTRRAQPAQGGATASRHGSLEALGLDRFAMKP
jgi:hypothetical protein